MSDNSNKKGGSAKLASLTARELELAGLVFQCFDGAFPKVSSSSHLRRPIGPFPIL